MKKRSKKKFVAQIRTLAHWESLNKLALTGNRRWEPRC